jgi:cytochrome bd-type quinol oxidase subunit 1
MEYPIWQVPFVNGGLLIAVISVIHVYVAHFAVGGGLFLVLAERRAYRDNSPAILAFTKRSTRFFLLLTTVFGGLTGVAIWFVIGLVSPTATSLLARGFLYGWATEWAFFLGEIVALFVYYYSFGRLKSRTDRWAHQAVGWIYFLFAWLSLATITGILSFMLSPGGWTGIGDFWIGFLNPTFWPQLVARTCLAIIAAGLFGLVGAVSIRDETARRAMTRSCALWAAVPVPVLLASAWWLYAALPPDQQAMVLRRTADIRPFLKAFLVLAPAVMLGGLLFIRRLPGLVGRPLALLLLLLGLFQIGSFEWVRETARRPWVVQGILYSNSIPAAEAAWISERGALACARWTRNKAVTQDNESDAGRELFTLQCRTCHGAGGPMLDLAARAGSMTEAGVQAQLTGLGRLSGYMPPFVGTEAEKLALGRYIVETFAQR